MNGWDLAVLILVSIVTVLLGAQLALDEQEREK